MVELLNLIIYGTFYILSTNCKNCRTKIIDKRFKNTEYCSNCGFICKDCGKAYHNTEDTITHYGDSICEDCITNQEKYPPTRHYPECDCECNGYDSFSEERQGCSCVDGYGQTK